MTDTTLRKDAEDNRRRLLTAAREVFAERGLEATLHDVARHAGVGVGTAYRRFANKDELFEAILTEQVDELEAVLHRAIAEPDAWTGLVDYLEAATAMQARDRGIAQIMSGRRVSREKHDTERDRLAPLVDELAERAREQGVVRADLTGTDLIFLQIGLTAIAQTARDGADSIERSDVVHLYRRYLWIALDGVRPVPAPTPLPVDALSTAETHQLLHNPAPH